MTLVKKLFKLKLSTLFEYIKRSSNLLSVLKMTFFVSFSKLLWAQIIVSIVFSTLFIVELIMLSVNSQPITCYSEESLHCNPYFPFRCPSSDDCLEFLPKSHHDFYMRNFRSFKWYMVLIIFGLMIIPLAWSRVHKMIIRDHGFESVLKSNTFIVSFVFFLVSYASFVMLERIVYFLAYGKFEELSDTIFNHLDIFIHTQHCLTQNQERTSCILNFNLFYRYSYVIIWLLIVLLRVGALCGSIQLVILSLSRGYRFERIKQLLPNLNDDQINYLSEDNNMYFALEFSQYDKKLRRQVVENSDSLCNMIVII